MERRKVLLVVATLIAALGTLLVVLYVRSADTRANDKFKAVNVLTVTKQINVGETVAAAQAAGKIKLGTVGEGQKLAGALDTLTPIQNMIAQTTLYPGEQVIQAKFAASVAASNSLSIPKGDIAISVNLTDTARVAGFVNPGDKVAIFATGPQFSRLLLTDIQVIAVGTTTVIPTTTTTSTGAQTTEQLPRTLFTLAVTQSQAQKILFAASQGDGISALAFGLLNNDSKVSSDSGASTANLFR